MPTSLFIILEIPLSSITWVYNTSYKSLLFLSILCIIARAIIQDLFSGFLFLSVRGVRLFYQHYKVHAFSYMLIHYIFFLQTFFHSLFYVLVKPKFFLSRGLFLIVSAWTTFPSWFYVGLALSYPSAQDFIANFPQSHSWLFSFTIPYMYSLWLAYWPPITIYNDDS